VLLNGRYRVLGYCLSYCPGSYSLYSLYSLGAPKRRTSPVPPHRRHVPQRRLVAMPVFFLVPLHRGQRRIGRRCTSNHQAPTAMIAMITKMPALLTVRLP
jgi:hypothetical protein